MRPKLWGHEDGEEEIGQRGGEGRRDGAESGCAVGGERRTGAWGLAWGLGSWQCSNNLFRKDINRHIQRDRMQWRGPRSTVGGAGSIPTSGKDRN